MAEMMAPAPMYRGQLKKLIENMEVGDVLTVNNESQRINALYIARGLKLKLVTRKTDRGITLTKVNL